MDKGNKRETSESVSCERLDLENEVRMLRKKITGYKGQVTQTYKVIDDLRKSVAAKNSEIAELTDKLEAREKLIDDMRTDFEVLKEELQEAQAMNRTYKSQIDFYETLPWYRRIFL